MAVIIGTSDSDVLSGTSGADSISGGDGNDVILGGAGDDILDGGAGNDLVRGEDGDDQIAGGDGDDNLRGGSGVDSFDGGANDTVLNPTSSYGDRVSFYEIRATQGVVADLRTGIISNDGFGNVETMVNIESLGGDTAYADTFYGNDDRNALLGGRGDFLYGFGGDDLISMSVAAAIVDGGTGTDLLTLDSSGGWLSPDSNGDGVAETAAAPSVGWTIDLGASFMRDGYGNTGTITGIENVTGSQLKDTITGDSGNNQIWGGAGDDVLSGGGGDDPLDGGDGHDSLRGGAGNDTLLGGNGDDFLNGGPGDDIIDGGAGFDRATFFSGATAGVQVDLNIHTAQDTGQGMDTITNVENVSGTSFADILIGDSGDNWLWGLGGADTLLAGGGNDLVTGGPGDVTADGGTEIDTFSVNDNGAGSPGVILSLALQGVAQATALGTMTLSGFENLSGSSGNDILTGDDSSNILAGDSGNDTLIGGDGNDTLYGDGRIGIDTHGVGTSGPMMIFTDVASFGAPDGDDSLQGGLGDDNLYGGGGNDLLDGGAGGDLMVGGTGNDVYIIDQVGGPGVTGDSVIENAGEGTDEIRTFIDWNLGGNPNVENLTALGTGNIMLAGNAGANVITGNSGNNYIAGGDGDDILSGGSGDDNLNGDAGNDTLNGGDGNDYLDGRAGNDLIDGGAGSNDIAAYRLAAGTPGTISMIDGTGADLGKLLVQITNGGVTQTFAKVTVTGQGGAIVEGVGIGAFMGTDTVSNVEQLHFYIEMADFSAPTQFVSVALTPTQSGNFVSGSEGSDTIDLANFSGAINVNGNRGDDTIIGTSGNNNLQGGSGNDVIFGRGGNDQLFGNDGNDRLVLDAPIAGGAYNGGTGTDTLEVRNWATAFAGINGPTTNVGLFGSSLTSIERLDFASQAGTGLTVQMLLSQALASGINQVTGGAGVDQLVLVVTTPGTYTMPTLTAVNWTTGSVSTAGDVIVLAAGTAGIYTLNASASHSGLEALVGAGGNDILNGSAGSEYLNGAGGVNQLHGGDGDDALAIINTTPNTLVGGVVTPSATTTFTGAGSIFDGGNGTDGLQVGGYVNFQGTLISIEYIYLQSAFTSTSTGVASQSAAVFEISGQRMATLPADLRLGGTGTIIVNLAAGDTFNGSAYGFAAGSNVLFKINGSNVADIIVGTAGNDDIDDSEGSDTITGGGGADIFRLTQGQNVVTDFTIGEDKIDLTDVGITSFGMLQQFLSQTAAGAQLGVLYDGVVQTLTLQGVALADLAASSFVFASGNDPSTSDATENADTLFGLGGNDLLNGLGGNDLLFGGGGADQLVGGEGDDRLVLNAPISSGGSFDGGTGTDTLELRNWANASASTYGPTTFAALFGSSLTSIERLDFASQAGTGITVQMALGQAIASGLNQVTGGAGVDQLLFFVTTPGTHTIPTLTTVNWTAGSVSVAGDVVILAAGTAGNYTLNASASHSGLEALVGAAGNDILNGSAGSEYLNGAGGVNQLHGGDGDDALAIINNTPNTLVGGVVTPGTTTTFTGAGSIFDGGNGTDGLLVGGYVNFQGTLVSIEYIYLQPAFTSTNTNVASQSAAVLEISGQTMASLPADLRLGGTGTIIVNLAAGDSFNGSAYGFAAGSNVVFNIIGSGAADTIIGTVGNDLINGGAGVDVVQFSGNRSDYTSSALAGGLVGISSAFTGSDSFANVEIYRFADGDFAWDAATNDLAQINEGVAFDGYLSGARVFIDVNNNGLFDAGEPFAITDATGNYTLVSNAVGPLRATGGVNVDTGVANLLTLSAPDGSSVINPLTTLVQALIADGHTQSEAETQVKTAFGLDASLDLTSYDMLAAPVNDPTALLAQKAAASVVVVLEAVVSLSGDSATGEAAGLSSLAEAVTAAAAASQPLNLANSTTLTAILTDAVPTAGTAITSLVTVTQAETAAIGSATSIGGISVVQGNNAPTPTNDVATVTEDSVVTGNVRSNDSDPDAADHTFVSAVVFGAISSTPGTAIAGTYGTLLLQADGTYTYSADADYLDTLRGVTGLNDVFTYTLADGHGGIATATLTVNVLLANDERTTRGGNGVNIIHGDQGGMNGAEDTIFGGSAADQLFGEDGADTLWGGAGDDKLSGGQGRDSLYGEAGNDILDGGLGDDRLEGGKGDDRLTGGAGSDIFIFGKSSGSDTITDFQRGIDHIQLVDGVTLKSSVFADVNHDGVLDLVLQLSSGSVTLLGVSTPLPIDTFI